MNDRCAAARCTPTMRMALVRKRGQRRVPNPRAAAGVPPAGMRRRRVRDSGTTHHLSDCSEAVAASSGISVASVTHDPLAPARLSQQQMLRRLTRASRESSEQELCVRLLIPSAAFFVERPRLTQKGLDSFLSRARTGRDARPRRPRRRVRSRCAWRTSPQMDRRESTRRIRGLGAFSDGRNGHAIPEI
jgi:hypothetical protein